MSLSLDMRAVLIQEALFAADDDDEEAWQRRYEVN